MLSPELTRVRDAAIQWLREQYRRLRNSRITPTDGIQRGKTSDFPSLGKMYFYAYDPKTKAKLKHYDTFPLVFPVKKFSDGFLGLNLHYLATWWDVLECAKNLDKFDNKTLTTVEEFLNKPSEWSKTNGGI